MDTAADIRLITLDLDDTLWPCAAVIEQAERAQHAWLAGTAASLTAAHDIDSLRAHRRTVMSARPELAHDLTAVRIASLRELLAHHGHPASLAEQATRVFRDARNRVTPYPDVMPILQALARRYQLVTVSNGNAEVHHTPLRGRFHLCLSAADVGAAKPDPALFRAALDYAGAAPHQAVHVGDDPYLDIAAARALGMRTVWINRRGAPWPADLAPADGVATDLHGLCAWLETTHRGGASAAPPHHAIP